MRSQPEPDPIEERFCKSLVITGEDSAVYPATEAANY